MTVPLGAIAAAAKVLSVHRWKSMGIASVECECGAILRGPEDLTQFPADETFRRHLAEAMLEAAAPLLRAEGAAAERDRIAALANQVVATYRVRDGSRHARIRPFADLLRGAP